jgi:alpha-L-arabinofuranosidase
MERLTNGYEVADLTEQQRLASPIETGRWYDIRLEVGSDTVKCYLDDSLIMTYYEPPSLFSLAGRDEKTGDLIVKIVNAASDPYRVRLHIDGANALQSQGESTVLAADRPDAENSFRYPRHYVPVRSEIQGIGPDFETAVPPYSISVLRIH